MKLKMTTTLILFGMILSQESLWADRETPAATTPAACDPTCITNTLKGAPISQKIKEALPDLLTNPNSLAESEDQVLEGSEGFVTCMKYMNASPKTVYENPESAQWVAGILINNKSVKQAYQNYSTNKTAPNVTALANAINEVMKNKVPKCLAVLHLMKENGRTFNEESTKKVDPASNNRPSVIMQNQNGSLAMNGSEDLGCKSQGVETLDFDSCKKFNDAMNYSELATKATQVVQSAYYTNKAMDTSFEAQKNMGTDATAALKAQKSNLKDQQELFTQNSTIELSKAAILANIKSEHVNSEKLQSQCASFSNSNFGMQAKDLVTTTDAELINQCKSTFNNSSNRFALLQNVGAGEKMTSKIALISAKGAAEGVNAVMAAKRADQVGDAIAKVDGFKPVETPGLQQAVEATFCQMNPAAEKCKNSLGQQFSTIGNGIVDFNGNGANGVYTNEGSANAVVDDASGAGNNTNPSASNPNGKSINTIGQAIVDANKGGGIENAAAAASLKDGKAPSGGGGGGGGGGGIGGGTGGGGAGGAGGSQEAKVSAAQQGKGPKYDSMGAGITTVGKLGANNKKSDSANPFGNMFDKKGAVNDKLVNFGRGPASVGVNEKGDNLFDIIHKRYGWANDKKLMIEYEEVK